MAGYVNLSTTWYCRIRYYVLVCVYDGLSLFTRLGLPPRQAWTYRRVPFPASAGIMAQPAFPAADQAGGKITFTYFLTACIYSKSHSADIIAMRQRESHHADLARTKRRRSGQYEYGEEEETSGRSCNNMRPVSNL